MAIKIPQKQSSGGGGIGGVLGAIGGAIAAPFTGGASLAATLPMIGAGASIGSTIGNAVAPPKASGPSALGGQISGSTDALARALAKKTEDPVDTIRQGIMATAFMPPGQERANAFSTLHQAHMAAMNLGSSPGAPIASTGEGT
jgi:hypothetical protein